MQLYRRHDTHNILKRYNLYFRITTCMMYDVLAQGYVLYSHKVHTQYIGITETMVRKTRCFHDMGISYERMHARVSLSYH